MNIDLIPLIGEIFKVILTPLIVFIAVMVTRTNRRIKLVEYKIYAMVHAIQSDLASNGFTEKYEKKLDELLKEYDWLRRNNFKK